MHILRIAFFTAAALLLAACTRNTQQDANANANSPAQTSPVASRAQQIVDQSIAAHGGYERYEQVALAFEFRDRTYKVFRKNGLYQYERLFSDNTGQVRDVLTNDGFRREIDGQPAFVPDTMQVKYTGSIGSVVYFAMLPFPLNDPAVIKEYLGETTLKGRLHHKIRVSFHHDGGGPDHEDIYLFWFDAETHFMNYLAYLFYTDGGGIRFREAYNPRTVGGIRMVDYVNYKADPASVKLDEVDALFEKGELEMLSQIESERIRVAEERPL